MLRLKKLKVRDFQSIAEADIPIGGFTVIVGASDVGKSALVRALSAVVNSRKGADCIRTGARSAKVALQFEDGVVLWERAKAIRYTLKKTTGEPSQYEKVGVSVPQEISDFHRLGGISVGDVEVKINLAGQFDPPFLLTETAPARAKLLSSITGAGFLLNMIAIIVSKSRDLLRRKKEVQERLGEAELDLTKYSVVDKILPDLETARTQNERLSGLVRTVEALEVTSKRATQKRLELTDLEVRIPDLNTAALAETKLRDLDRIRRLIVAAKEITARMVSAQKLVSVAVPHPGNLDREFGTLDQLHRMITALEGTNSKCARILGSMSKADEHLLQLAEDKHRLEDELGVCPLCGRAL